MKVISISLVISLLAPFVTHSSGVSRQSTSRQQNRPKLVIELTADKMVYRPKDDIKLTVMIVNDELSDAVFIYGDLGFGHAGTFTIFRRDAKGREVPTRFIDEYRGRPPNLNDPNTFVKLSPGNFLGTGYENSIYNLNLERPGKYRIWVEYHSPISRSEAKVAPFWGSEDGNVKSNVLEILVRS